MVPGTAEFVVGHDDQGRAPVGGIGLDGPDQLHQVGVALVLAAVAGMLVLGAERLHERHRRERPVLQVGPEVGDQAVEEFDDGVLVVAGRLEGLPVPADRVGHGVGPLVLGAGGIADGRASRGRPWARCERRQPEGIATFSRTRARRLAAARPPWSA